MKVAVLQSNYIPWKGYFELINDVDVFCFYDEVQYTKNDWRNRNRLLNSNGLFWVSIPINKKYTKLKISETKIQNPDILKSHFKTITQCYSKSPYSSQILDLLSPYYLDKKWEYLSQFNQTLIKVISKYIGIKTIFKDSSEFTLEEGRIDRLVNLNIQLKSSSYLSGPAAKGYLSGNEHLFKDNNIELIFKSYGPYLKYKRNTSQFDHSVSIIDLLMNIPKNELLTYITSQNANKKT
jgi:hypothetical protein